MAMRLVMKVAFRSGRMPKRSIVGCHSVPVRKARTLTSRKNPHASLPKVKTMSAVVTTETAAQKRRKVWIILSAGRAFRARLTVLAVRFSSDIGHPVAEKDTQVPD
jgi:hypothetical protein